MPLIGREEVPLCKEAEHPQLEVIPWPHKVQAEPWVVGLGAVLELQVSLAELDRLGDMSGVALGLEDKKQVVG